MFGAGNDRLELEPLDPDGNRKMDLDNPEEGEVQTIGCHTGMYAGLNVMNPLPDHVYMWANDNPRDRLMVAQRGGQIVQGDDPELAAEEQRRRDSLLRGPDDYIEDGKRNADEMDAGHRHGGLRYSRMDHRFKATAGPDEADRTMEVWSPSAGIVREG
jgi:hypothetical protein